MCDLFLSRFDQRFRNILERLCTNTLSQLKTYVAKFVYIFVMQIYYTFVISLDHGGPCHLSHDLGYWDKIPAENCSNKCLNRHLKLYFNLWLIHPEICTLKIMALCHVTERYLIITKSRQEFRSKFYIIFCQRFLTYSNGRIFLSIHPRNKCF